jgi:hypothetical protein
MTKIDLQNAEFDALDRLIEKYKVMLTLVVDDDYPEVRRTESALRPLSLRYELMEDCD